MKFIRIKLIFVFSIILFLAVAPVMAQDLPPEPGFTDGTWNVIITHAGSVQVGDSTGYPTISGGGIMQMIDGIPSGKYQFAGTQTMSGPDTSGTGTLTSTGEWTGTATKPAMTDGQTSIEGTITVDGKSQNVSFTFPASDSITVIPIISATCTVVIGNWPYVANAAFAGTGANPSLSGQFIAMRVAEPLIDDKPPDYFTKASSFSLSGAEFLARVSTTGVVDYRELDSLLSDAEDFYNHLQRQAECGIGDAKDYLGALGSMVVGLMEYALDHPESFNNIQLLRIAHAGVRMGVFGGGNPVEDGVVKLGHGLEMDFKAHQTESEDKMDCDGSMALLAMGALLTDGSMNVDLAYSVGKVC